jgi:RNA polymerase sigma factor (sigma-70 family)
VLGLLRRLGGPVAAESDAALLDRFARGRDEAAFAALVSRHGPMVLGVCRRTLGDAHAAEDAFQAAFLVLARKAGSLARPEELAGWLHGVARRVALKARSAPVAGRGQQLPGGEAAPPSRGRDPLAELTGRELLAILEEEIERLPAAYRLAVTLCCLEGLSQEEAALRLNATVGALRGRLERGRARLYARLAGRGMVPAAVLAVAGFARVSTAATVPARVAGQTARAALRFLTHGPATAGAVPARPCLLAEKVLNAMFLNKLKALAAGLLVAAFVAAGPALFTDKSATAGPTPGTAAPEEKPAAPVPALPARPGTVQAVLEQKLLGVWESGLDCVGSLTLRADGTYERRGFSPGNNTLAGAWAVRWDALPPTLVLTCKTSDDKDYVGTTEEGKLTQLDDTGLAYRWPDQKESVPYARVKAGPPPPAPPAKPGKDLAALEQKLHGEWKGGPCNGELTMRADGTFERHHYSPGNNHLTGAWEVRWNALPPTLALTCKTSDRPDFVGRTLEVKLIHLDDQALVYQFPDQKTPTPYSRVKK